MTEQKSASPLLYAISILSAAGAAISIWQTRLFYVTRSGMSDFHSFCNIGQNFDCTAIEMSKYSEIFGGFPLSDFAIAGYLLILTLAIMGVGSELFQRNVKKFLVGFSALSVLFSLTYLAIMVGLIGKLCLFCLGVDAINIALLVLSLRLPANSPAASKEGRPGIQFTHLASAGVASLLVAFMLARGLNPQAEVKQEDLNDVVDSVLNAPAVAVDYPADSPFLGDPDAKVTIVKFSDYECPACKMGATAIHPLFKRYTKGVKFVFVNFPLDQACNPDIPRKMHEYACEAAEVAICGAEQGKFLETYETLFENQKDFSAGKIADLLAEHVPGIDVTKLKACMTLPSTGEKLRRDITSGGKTKMNIQSTPTFYINGKKVEGGLPTNLWVQVIDRLLKS